MFKVKSEEPKVKGRWQKTRLKILGCGFAFYLFTFAYVALLPAQENDIEFNLDINSPTIALPGIFNPNIDLSGRGFNYQHGWPQNLAAGEVLDLWQQEIGFTGVFHLQYNLWEINQLAKDTKTQEKLLANYEQIIQRVNAEGAVVILDIFGMPAGLGTVLDQKSPPVDPRVFKELIKGTIRFLSCEKKYNIWYEVWSAPDLDSFFVGRKQEYLNLYRAVAEAIKELEQETKHHIPLGGPAVSWWFQDFDGNTILTPERSLIYEWLKFSSAHKLPVDFISWHAYSSDPQVEKEITRYKKTGITLIRDWLSYFNFDRNTPLIIDEWNYDSGVNMSLEREANAFISASYIPARILNMYEAGLDNQIYFSLEDFENKKEGINRNTGAFWFDSYIDGYRGGGKVTYNVFRMLASLGNALFVAPGARRDFVTVIATKKDTDITLIIANYIDPEIARNYLSRNIAGLADSERRILLRLIKSEKLAKILTRQIEIRAVRATKRLKTMLEKARELNESAAQFKSKARDLRLSIKNLKGNYLYQRYVLDVACSRNCSFVPVEEKDIPPAEIYRETLSLVPYSVNMVVFKKQAPQIAPVQTGEASPDVSGGANIAAPVDILNKEKKE